MMVKAEANEPEALLDGDEGTAASIRARVRVIHEFAVDGGEVHIACSPVANVALVGRGSRVPISLATPQIEPRAAADREIRRRLVSSRGR